MLSSFWVPLRGMIDRFFHCMILFSITLDYANYSIIFIYKHMYSRNFMLWKFYEKGKKKKLNP